MTTHLRILILCGLLTSPLGWSAERPNFLFVMLDDSGWTDFGCYGADIETPHIDQLAKEGIRFTDCHAPAPNCSPSRAGFLTGRIPSRVGMYSYIPPKHPMHLRAEEITIAEVLKEKGYATAHFGKWHLSDLENTEQPAPNQQGFDHSLGTSNNAQPSHKDPVNFIRNGQAVGKVSGYACQIVIDEFTQWFEKVPEDQPFFGLVWFHEPHSRIASPPELVSYYQKQDPALTKKEATYYANIANVDLAVGRLLKALKASGKAENTVVFLTSDNGGVNAHSNQGLRGRKSFVYEGGQREPGILRWPAKIKPDQVSDTTISSLDLFPTVCEIVGTPLPKDRKIDGTSLLPHLLGKGPLKRETPLFWYFYRVQPAAALRDGDHIILGYLDDPIKKHTHALTEPDMPMIKSAPLKSFELYDLKTDLAQEHDLSHAQPKRLRSMKEKLIALHRDVVADGPVWDLKNWRKGSR